MGQGTSFKVYLPVTEETSFDGALAPSGRVLGTYIHGLFLNAELRRCILRALARAKGVTLPPLVGDHSIDQEYDKLADWVRASLNMDLIYQMSGLVRDFEAPETTGCETSGC